MPTAIHERFLDLVEDKIRCQLKILREGPDKNKAHFAQKIQPARSSEIRYAAASPLLPPPAASPSKNNPDASFWHDDAQYPGVVLEVAYSQKQKALDRLVETYLLDSDASVQVVIGLDIGYERNKTRLATLSVWRTQIVPTTADTNELRVVKVVADQVMLYSLSLSLYLHLPWVLAINPPYLYLLHTY